MPDFDVVVIGAGAAGLSVAAISAGLGLKVALIERGRMGGDCLNYGCVPSKALLAAGHAAAEARAAHRFGIRLPAPEIDWAGVRAHVHGAIARIAPVDSVERFTSLGVEVIQAAACFTAPDRIEAGGRSLSFRRAVVAAGSSAIVPNLPGLDGVPWLTNETLFELEEPPGHLIILGGGPIGLEMAQAHARLGCLVTVLEAAPSVAVREDPELVAGLRAALLADGVEFREGVKVTALEQLEPNSRAATAGVVAVLEDGSRVAGTHLLLAVGRAPRLSSLDLVAGGVEAGPRGIVTRADLRSVSNRRVWAVGDIADPQGIGPRAFTHVASQHAGILVRSMLFRLPFIRVSYAALPRVTYTDPELVQVGLTEAEAREQGHAGVTIQHASLADNDRAIAEARADGAEAGMVKLVIGKDGKLLGAGVLAPRAGEMAGMFGLMIGRKLPLSALAGMVLPYPTLAEAAKRAAGAYYAPKLLSSFTKRVIGLLKHLP
ncbi:MAG: dihydrolipoamide dehydrogenase [Belnapia sp.]|nr:dihydrolipoamide dehydrogenase [Belnapia sp.]